MTFKDHFSKQSDIYLKARPTYPDSLFTYLASISPSTDLCLDCATGNGQAAVSLAKHFKKVIATDASKEQIQNAIEVENIIYKVAKAEQSGLPDQSCDLITVATGAHWFNHYEFYAEVNRILKPKGIIAVWTYSEAKINPEIDTLMEWFMYDFLHDYWPDGRWYVRNKYSTLPFPFVAMNTPEFSCEVQWNKNQWLNYVRSWSSYNKYISKHNDDAISYLLPALNKLWNDEEVKSVIWPLHLKCARV
jgi:ubiquinone/menaquinone biosynthesis C-methylase UbiE